VDKTPSSEWTSLLRYMPSSWHEVLSPLLFFELRVRVDKPLQIVARGGERLLPLTATSRDIKHLVAAFSQSSLYAFEEELKQGYITLPGGHRVGFAGKVLQDGAGKVRGLKDISSLCLRVARTVPGCADRLLSSLLDPGGVPYHTLLVSPPQGGKTTMLRDIVRQVSDGGQRVCVVDERSEIAGCYQGRPQLDVGRRTDVLDACPKAQGMLMALRALSPNVLVTDEVGRAEDVAAIEEALNAGVRVLATAHGANLGDVARRPQLAPLMGRNLFQRVVIMSTRCGPGTVEYVGEPLSAGC